MKKGSKNSKITPSGNQNHFIELVRSFVSSLNLYNQEFFVKWRNNPEYFLINAALQIPLSGIVLGYPWAWIAAADNDSSIDGMNTSHLDRNDKNLGLKVITT